LGWQSPPVISRVVPLMASFSAQCAMSEAISFGSTNLPKCTSARIWFRAS